MSVGKQEPRHDSVRIRVDLTDPTATKHHAVFCYETTYFEWLPQVIPGDVLVLRNVQAGKYGNLNGRERRYRWTAYDPTTAQFKVPIWGTAPKEENGFSPFYESPPSEGTIRKCEEIANWALTRLDSGTNAETRNSAANAVAPSSRILHDLGALNTSLPGISGRKHLLLDEASGYFDCTVEIVGGGPGYGCYNLSVVDYTIPRGVYPNANREIPEAKRQYVLTIECSREAESPAVKLKVGSVYRIENVLAKTRKGYVQGSAIDNKFKELDVRAEPRDKALDALLRRKAELRFASAPSIREFDHRSLKNIDKEGHTTLIVEMVHGEPAPNDGNFYFIFVTDFTYNQPDLPHLDLLFNSPKPRSSHRLEHRILKIRLDNGQQQYGPEMQVGKAYRIVNASVRRNKKWIRGEFVATLGGAANLIHPLDEGSEEWKALQESKDRWRGVEPVQDLVDVEPEAPDFDLAKVPKKSFRPEGVAVAEWPPVCTMLARVVSMKPGYLHLEDCSPLYCSKCSYPLPKRDDSGKKYSTKKCPTCKVECTKRMLSFHVTVEEITSGLRFPVYVGISEEQTKLPLLQKLKQVTGSAKPGNLSVEFYHSLFERFMQRMVGDEESREAGESFLKHCAWMVYTVAKYDTTSVALCDYEKP
ncbi:hypothetical protein BDV98DRAFT_567928 [Pterulicium gracile]|uniref:Protection of telomeres protein 1 n=1 Tax=Pterulicium gracile TaxID=1884261 RepID=A0A5C3QIJ8_9AGAR|nr:hypothetical protein BDV98DRAFT_567928 [Pterula gracilis]